MSYITFGVGQEYEDAHNIDTILVGYATVRGRLHIGILALRRNSHETTSCLHTFY